MSEELKLVGDIWEPALNDDAKFIIDVLENGCMAATVAVYYNQYFIHTQSRYSFSTTTLDLKEDHGIVDPYFPYMSTRNTYHVADTQGYFPLSCDVTDYKFVAHLDDASKVFTLTEANGKFDCRFTLLGENGQPFEHREDDTWEATVRVIEVNGLSAFKDYLMQFKLADPGPVEAYEEADYKKRIHLQHWDDMRYRDPGYDPQAVDQQWFEDFLKKHAS